MAPSLALVDRHQILASFEDGLRYTLENAFTKDNGYTLFRWEDWPAWVIFTTVFLALIFFDNVILHRNPHALTMTRAVLYTFFWMVCACGFCAWVAWWYSTNSAYMWMSGYMLEWMLSFDNLFVFHLIFSSYHCPDNLKHRPLYLGICGAVVFRLVFIFIGEYLMHAMSFMHLVFGAFLVYTGIQTVAGDEDDDNPREQTLVIWLEENMSLVSYYCKNASFFVYVPVNKATGEVDIPEEAIVKQEATENDHLVESGEKDGAIPVVDFSHPSVMEKINNLSSHRVERKATMLFLVVCCLEISDILFAVDSVSAIVAQVPDLFLAYTSAVFAMLGLRAMFFIIDVLSKIFSLLKYGVGIVLVFIGIKLIVGKFYHIPAGIVCLVLVGAIAGSMVASVIKDKLGLGEDDEDGEKPSSKHSSKPASACASPFSPVKFTKSSA